MVVAGRRWPRPYEGEKLCCVGCMIGVREIEMKQTHDEDHFADR
jgi:hypothetical protein